MKRYLSESIYRDLPSKIVLLMGARQCGKTTLSQSLLADYDYYNFDALSDREIIYNQQWDRQKELIIFDELHKMTEWKRWLKGIYDTEGLPPSLLVTGSAKMNTFKRVGDSLAGRHFPFTLHPFDMKELIQATQQNIDDTFEQFLHCGPFPEPFLKGEATYYKRWRHAHIDMILRQDLLDLYTVHDIKAIETLIMILRSRVGGSISYSNIARDLQKDVNTIKRYIEILEDLYVVYRVTPYAEKITRSLLKEPKFYFYDHNQVENSEGAKLENIVGNALKKSLDFIQDTEGARVSLHYLRTKNGQEVDFLTCIDGQPTAMIEVKTSDHKPAKHLSYFQKFLPDSIKCCQVVKNLKRELTTPDGIEVRKLAPWLCNLNIHNQTD